MAEVAAWTMRIRKLAGACWILSWTALLYLVAAPWRGLGGLENERLVWLEWLVLMAGLSVGATVGRFGRDFVLEGWGRTHARLLRIVLYPAGIVTAACLLVLAALEARGAIGVATTGFLAYWAGLDIAFAAVPLLEGKSYRFRRPLDPEPDPPGGRDDKDRDWVPPWERF